MREKIIFCSNLNDHIGYLTNKAIEYDTKMEESENKCEFNKNWLRYKDIKSELKYQESIYKNQCGMYDLFCRSIG